MNTIKDTRKIRWGLMLAMLALFMCFSGCTAKTTEDEGMNYHRISQKEAAEMMQRDDGHVVVDVRRQDEYDAGHIPGAILIPNESISTERPVELPDLEQIILVYCRSGNRSKTASKKLADMGYTNVYEFGGINTWDGPTVTSEEEAVKPAPVLVIEVNGKTFYASLEDNSSADVLAEKLSSGSLTLDMSDYGGFEKVGALPWSLPSNDERITTAPGDVVLYNGDSITIYYDSNTWSLTRLARIEASREELLAALGEDSAEVTFSIEWGE